MRKVFQEIKTQQLVPGEYQPRKEFEINSLQGLMQSIKELGILTPLLVRPKGDAFEIIAGERRWRAAKMAGLNSVPCLVSEEEDEAALIQSLVENLARQNLNPLEEAQGIDRLIRELHCTHEEVGKILGKSRAEITNLLRLLELDKSIHVLIKSGDLTETHGRLLASLPRDKQFPLAKMAVVKKWTTRDLEDKINQNKDTLKPKNVRELSADSKRLERKLSEYFAAKIRLEEKGTQKGELRIPYNSLDELDGILIKMGLFQDGNDF